MSTEPAPNASLLDQLRSRIQVLSEQAVQKRDELSGERDQLLKAFLHVFPYTIYRDRRPDLGFMSDQQIAEHFACHGIREGISLEATIIAEKLLKSLQEENQALQAKQNDHEALIADYASRLSVLVHERDGLSGERDQLGEAFLHVFPYTIYRDQRPDLASMNDQQIAEHFAHNGIREGISLEAKVITGKEIKSLQEENQALQAKQDDLEALIADYASRLSLLQDLFVRLSLEGRKE